LKDSTRPDDFSLIFRHFSLENQKSPETNQTKNMVLNTEDATAISEWKDFLQSDREDVRRTAMDGVTRLAEMGDYIVEFVPLIARRCDSIEGLRALLHLVGAHGPTANACLYELRQAGGIPRLLEIALLSPNDDDNANSGNGDSGDTTNGMSATRILKDETRTKVNYAMSLLANLTRTEEGAVELVGKTLPEEAVSKENLELQNARPTMDLLLSRFLHVPPHALVDFSSLSPEALDSNNHDPYQHFAAVLMNSMQTLAGRRFVFQLHKSQPSVLERVLPQLRSINPIRRRGIAGVIRNACLDRDSAWWLLNTVSITKHILYPLAGPEALDVDEKQGLDPDVWLEGPDKVREPDHMTRLWLVEALLLLCTTGQKSRDTLRLARAYVVLKLADMVEEQEDVSERIYDIVNFLRRDEEGTPEGSSDQLVEKTYYKVAVSVGAQATTSEDFDEMD
jgi:Domain of unknown function (DUF383)/Domain of unknown function (DUF384)